MASSMVTSIISSATPSATSIAPPSSTSDSPSPSSTGQPQGDTNSGRPLLFFVALGFGVVFTNLWIIVGIKYCFRYNRRMRAGLLNDENGDPIDLNTMPGHRPRRRREKKLMSMEDVNSRFPLTRYKMWKSAREQQGLAPEGGVTVPASRPASVHAATAVVEATTAAADSKKTTAADDATSSTAPVESLAAAAKGVDSAPSPVGAVAKPPSSEKQPAEHNEHATRTETHESDLDEDDPDPINEPINPNISGFYPEEAPAGDSCAICIDVLEDDDEVRGLTCGHAFHAGCLDPWLTGRRACCPLCKADYYVPKPRAEGDAGAQGGAPGSSAPAAPGSRLVVPHPRHAGSMMMPHFPGRTRRMIFGGPPSPTRTNPASGVRQPAYNPRAMRQPGDSVSARAMTWFRTLPDNLPNLGMRQGQGARAAGNTPADLEAGQTRATTAERTAA